MFAAQLGRHHALDAADRQPQELEEHAHPFGVAARQVVVHRYHVYPHAGEGVEIDGKGGDEGFAFARGHFRDVAAVQGDAAE